MPRNTVIANTTPLIALANIGRLDLLYQLYGAIYIPEAVLSEIKSEPARTQVRTSNWIITEKITNEEGKKLFSSRLHAGEIEVMLLAEEKKADLLIIDDNAAKKTAKFMGFDVTGTMGILITAKQHGYISEVKPLLNELIDDGLFISDRVQQTVLKMAREV